MCRQPMSWFGDHWLCVNVKAHNNSVNKGKVVPFRRKRN